MSQPRFRWGMVAWGVLIIALSGCADGLKKFAVAPSSGRVLCEGKPVASASVLFNPVSNGKSALSGKQGYANTNDQGEFEISTYGVRDGAVVGKHKVIVAGDPKVPCDCVADDRNEVMEVEVKAGSANAFEVVLPKMTGPKKKVRRSSSDDE